MNKKIDIGRDGRKISPALWRLGFLFVNILLLCQLFGSPALAKEQKCLRYAPEVVTLTGTMSEETFPGPPHYESLDDGDEPIEYWFLYLDRPVCVYSNEKEYPSEYAESGVNKVQLVMHEHALYKTKRWLLDKKVSVTGTLFHRNTGYHHADILISLKTLDAIKPAKQNWP
ncbi:MAG: DUF4431 domain-containing protein [Nitrospinae bacterium]|nr:DUF4431 domain-containing protein [Nitrospinota bacterium]